MCSNVRNPAPQMLSRPAAEQLREAVCRPAADLRGGALLAALGLYGVMSYGTTLRIKEFGIRIAIGAGTSDILQLVMKEGLMISLIGVGLAACSALAARGITYWKAEAPSFLSVSMLVSCGWS